MNSVGMKCNVRGARSAMKQRATRVVQCRATANNAKTVAEKVKDASKVVAAIGASVLVAGSAVPSAQALTFAEKQALTYLQVKGSGLANTCPVLDDGVSDLKALGSVVLMTSCVVFLWLTGCTDPGVLRGGEADASCEGTMK